MCGMGGEVEFEPSFVSPLTKAQQRPEPGIFFFTRGFYYYSNACIVYVRHGFESSNEISHRSAADIKPDRPAPPKKTTYNV